ncbi:uncharacterized protein LOC141595383 [Silene latifolia]|uniref:uncharacterized protein LOC141595383 n=1 Tax=Silene latifolia TaxID=37657 RepID=UPI003D77052E
MTNTSVITSSGEPKKLDPLSPLSLVYQEGPGQSITHVHLRSDNYEDWSRSMRTSLKSRRKYSFCDGSITKPTDDFLLQQWEVVHCTIVQWIMNFVDDAVKPSVSHTENARDLWLDLEEQFRVVDGSRIHALKAQLHDCRQTKGMSVTSYFGDLKVLWDAISTVEPPFACKCGHCTCDIAKQALARQDSEKVHKFLMGLYSTLYRTIRSQQLALDPLPSLNRLYHLVLQEERHLSPTAAAAVEEPSDVMAFAVHREPSTPAAQTASAFAPDRRALRDLERQERRKFFCTHCKSNGHEVSSCFIKTQKFPDWWGDRPRTLDELTTKRQSRTPARANFFGSDAVSSTPQDRLSGMSPHWLIDTGASHHVTGDETWLADPYPIPPYPDRSLKTRIRVGELRDGLYLLRAVVKPTINQPVSNSSTADNGLGTDSGEAPVMGRGHRPKIPSTRLRGFVVGTTAGTSSDSDSSPDSPRSSGTPYDLANYLTCTNFSRNHRVFLADISNGVEPPSFRVAINDPRWCKAMEAEITALENNGTWELADLPSDKKALGCRWVYKIKYKSDGSIERYKGRLVIFGNHQVEGIDYGETFAPVIKMVTIRTFLSVAAVKNWELHQMDVHNAFLHGDLDEEVYMKLPPGFSKGKEGKVCRLRKSLYGLRQAPRCWFAKLTAALRKYGFTQSYYDYSLFSYVTTKVCIHVLVYVDDLVITGNDSVTISNFKTYLGQCFHMKDLGLLKYFLGIEVAHNKEGIFLNQRKYALDIISQTGLLGAKPAPTPIEQHYKLGVATNDFLADSESYRRLVGRLVYLAVTRPDLSYVVHILSRYLSKPRKSHMEAALRVVRYLKGRPGQGILLRSNSELVVNGWCDSDWGGCPSTRRSVSGWVLGSSPLS